jgi:hypothetical protein
VIPENVEHGEELICSYFACRNAGIKFRYCTHCKVPVAKRNFRKRHKHGKPAPNELGEDEASHSGVEEPESPVKKTEVDSSKSAVEAYSLSQERAPNNMSTTNGIFIKPDNEKAKVVDDKEGKSSVPVVVSGQGPRVISAERKRLWADLLLRRPLTKDGEAVSAWLMDVLSISDLETPLGEKSDRPAAGGMPTPNKAAEAAPSKAAEAPRMVTESAPPPTLSLKESNTTQVEKKKEMDSMPGHILLMKKRPLPTVHKDDSDSHDEDSSAKESGSSFAEWKERKKKKGLTKMESDSADE